MSTWSVNKPSAKAFTLIELMVTITIIGILIAAAGVSYGHAKSSARDSARLSDVLLIAKSIDQSAKLNNNLYPVNATPGNTTKIMCANELYTSANPNKLDVSIFTNNTIPKDPTAYQPKVTGCTGINNGYTYHTYNDSSIAQTQHVY